MKRITRILAVLILIGIIVLVANCNKEKTKEDNNIESKEKYVPTDICDNTTDIYLTNFKAKLKNSNYSKEELTIDSAYWHLEALLNYDFGDVGHSISLISYDTMTYSKTLLRDGMTLLEFNEVFNLLSKDVRKIFLESDLPDKSILAIAIIPDLETATFQAVVIIRGLTRDLLNPTFDTTDYWNSGHDYGKCGAYSNEPVGQKSAVTQLTSYLNYRIPLYACAGHTTPYITDFSFVNLLYYGSDDFMIDSNSPCGYKLFTNDRLCSDPYACLSPIEMNYYLNAGESIMWHYKPDDKVIVDVLYSWSQCDGLEACPEAHFMDITYGKLNCHTPTPDM